MSEYKTTVGIEVHAELKTRSKMFCGCKNDPHGSEANANVCPVCMAHPGSLPVVNKEAVRSLYAVGTAIGGELADFSEFDRKNYFYPDIPKAYQISQYQYPFVSGGELAGVAITRIHLEEDTARSIHDQGEESLVDYNRAGVPLMELVTEPVIHSPEEAGKFAKELQLLLRTLGVSEANMEKGELRVEANISVSKSATLGTKVEVKNLNSFKSVEAAIAYEVQRHIEVLERGEAIFQETRGWDEQKGKTFSQRLKESADDYRYFPDPDIPKFLGSEIQELHNSRFSEMIENTPVKIREKFSNLGITKEQTEVLLSDVSYLNFFSDLLSRLPESVEPKFAANYFLSDVLSLLSSERSLESANPAMFAELLALNAEGGINSRVTKDLLLEVVFDSLEPRALAESRGLIQKNDAAELEQVIDKILSEHTAVVEEFRSGKEAALQFLLGQAMKATRGAANPAKLQELMRSKIG